MQTSPQRLSPYYILSWWITYCWCWSVSSSWQRNVSIVNAVRQTVNLEECQASGIWLLTKNFLSYEHPPILPEPASWSINRIHSQGFIAPQASMNSWRGRWEMIFLVCLYIGVLSDHCWLRLRMWATYCHTEQAQTQDPTSATTTSPIKASHSKAADFQVHTQLKIHSMPLSGL